MSAYNMAPTKVARMTAFIKTMRLPRRTTECERLLARAGFDLRDRGRIYLAKKRAGVESYRVRDGWAWRRKDAESS